MSMDRRGIDRFVRNPVGNCDPIGVSPVSPNDCVKMAGRVRNVAKGFARGKDGTKDANAIYELLKKDSNFNSFMRAMYKVQVRPNFVKQPDYLCGLPDEGPIVTNYGCGRTPKTLPGVVNYDKHVEQYAVEHTLGFEEVSEFGSDLPVSAKVVFEPGRDSVVVTKPRIVEEAVYARNSMVTCARVSEIFKKDPDFVYAVSPNCEYDVNVGNMRIDGVCDECHSVKFTHNNIVRTKDTMLCGSECYPGIIGGVTTVSNTTRIDAFICPISLEVLFSPDDVVFDGRVPKVAHACQATLEDMASALYIYPKLDGDLQVFDFDFRADYVDVYFNGKVTRRRILVKRHGVSPRLGRVIVVTENIAGVNYIVNVNICGVNCLATPEFLEYFHCRFNVVGFDFKVRPFSSNFHEPFEGLIVVRRDGVHCYVKTRNRRSVDLDFNTLCTLRDALRRKGLVLKSSLGRYDGVREFIFKVGKGYVDLEYMRDRVKTKSDKLFKIFNCLSLGTVEDLFLTAIGKNEGNIEDFSIENGQLFYQGKRLLLVSTVPNLSCFDGNKVRRF